MVICPMTGQATSPMLTTRPGARERATKGKVTGEEFTHMPDRQPGDGGSMLDGSQNTPSRWANAYPAASERLRTAAVQYVATPCE